MPGHGFVDDARTLKEELQLRAAGVSAEDAPARADLGEFSDWTVREAMAPSAIRRVYAELSGTLK